MLTQVYFVWFGTMSTTANAVCMTLSGFYMMTGNAISMALMTIAGQCIGMGAVGEAKRYIKRATYTGSVLCALTSVILLPLARPILGLYSLPAEAFEMAYGVSFILLVGNPLTWCPSFVTPSGLRAGGDAKFSTVAALSCMWALRVGLGYLLGVALGRGIYGVWVAMYIEWAVRGVVFHLRANGEKWHSHTVIKA